MNRFQAIDPAVLGLKPGDHVLDVGCGVGRHVLELSKTPGCHVGIDRERVDLLKARYWSAAMCGEGRVPQQVQALQAEAAALPFSDGAFHRVICTEVLEHVPDDRAVLAELARVLRPGGVLAISVPHEFAERLFWWLSRQYRNHPGGHVRIYRWRELVRLLEQGGLRPFALRFRHSLESLYWLLRLLDSKQIAQEGPVARKVRPLLNGVTPQLTALLDRLDALGNYLLPKSIVLYARKPREALA